MDNCRTQRVFIKTLGCDKNTVDSQNMIGEMMAEGYSMTGDPAEAEVIIINTCCFIETAKEESIDTILEYVDYKRRAKCDTFIVAGCMAQRYALELQNEIPEIDHFLGVNNLEDIRRAITVKDHTIMETDGAQPEYKEASVNRYIEAGDVTAYLKISEGCDKHCTYCAIPSIRGPYRSRKPEAILKEAQGLRDAGVEELILIAQDLTQYGVDLPGNHSLASLLKTLAETIDFPWIRLLYLYPEGIDEALIEVVATHPNICHYFDMPIQHTEDRVLKRMGRQVDKKTICEKVAAIRRAIPDVVLRTTIITGFPGEGEEDFDAMLGTLKDLHFERLGAFAYSMEEGTPAASMDHQVEDSLKEERRRQVYEQQEVITGEQNAELVGKTMTVLIEENDGFGVYYGRTYGDAPEIDCGIIVEDESLEEGRFYRIRMTQSLGFDIIGEKE